jgi:hypothetical protein
MPKNKKIKPTNNDFVIVINSLIQEIHSLKNDMDVIMGTFDMYVDYKGDGIPFKEHVEAKLKVDNELRKAGQDNKETVITNPSD